MNIRRPNHVLRDEETSGIQPISMASRTDNRFSFYHFVPIISTFYNDQACHSALQNTYTYTCIQYITLMQ